MSNESHAGATFGRFLLSLILGGALGAALLTAAWLLIPRTYTSSATILFPGGRSGGSATGAMGMGDTAGSPDQPSLPLMQGLLSVPQHGTSPATANLILHSRTVTTSLISQFAFDKAWGMGQEETIEEFRRRFTCLNGPANDLTIAFTDHRPEIAQHVVNEAVAQLRKAVGDLNLDPASRNFTLLQDSLRQAERDCTAAEQALVEFQRRVGGAPPDMQMQALAQTLTEMERNQVTAELEAHAAQSNLEATVAIDRKMIENAIDPANSGNALLTTLFGEVVALERDLEILRSQFTDKRPEVVKARQALEVARGRLDAEINRQLDGMKSGASPYVRDLSITAVNAKARVSGLRKALTQVKGKLDTLPEAQVKYAQLTTDLRDFRTRLQLVRTEHAKAELIVQSRGPQFVVLDAPNLPHKANGRPMIDFLLIGAAIGSGLVLLRATFAWLKRVTRNLGMV